MIMAEISGGVYRLPWTSIVATSLGPDTTLYGTRVISDLTSLTLRPMKRLIEKTVFCGFVTACRFATWPTSRSPSLVNPTTDGVVRPPSAFGMTTGSPPSMTATTELVVPRSIPMTLSAIAASIKVNDEVGYPADAAHGRKTGAAHIGHFGRRRPRPVSRIADRVALGVSS